MIGIDTPNVEARRNLVTGGIFLSSSKNPDDIFLPADTL